MRAANLLPPDIRRSAAQSLPTEALAGLAAGVAVASLLAVGYVTVHGTVTKRERELADVKAQLAAVPTPKPAKDAVAPELAAEKDQRMSALDGALSSRVAWDGILRELSLILPDDVWLNSLSAKAGAPSADPTAGVVPSGVTLTGYTYSQEGVARLLTRLALVPQFGNVQLQSSSGATVGSRHIVGFTIAADIRPSGGSQ